MKDTVKTNTAEHPASAGGPHIRMWRQIHLVINLSILISGSQRTRWCLCVYCATVGFPYFGGPLGQCLEPMYAQLLSE